MKEKPHFDNNHDTDVDFFTQKLKSANFRKSQCQRNLLILQNKIKKPDARQSRKSIYFYLKTITLFFRF